MMFRKGVVTAEYGRCRVTRLVGPSAAFEVFIIVLEESIEASAAVAICARKDKSVHGVVVR
jgi:hypothetical protein